MYGWREMLEVGLAHEDELDSFFCKWYRIEPVTIELQRLGVDRIFHRDDGSRISVEYKADDVASRTRNAFIETVSVDIDGKPGWALSSIAQVLIYYIPMWRDVYMLRMLDLKMDVPELATTYKAKPVQNNGYITMGLPVPLKVVKDRYLIAERRIPNRYCKEARNDDSTHSR